MTARPHSARSTVEADAVQPRHLAPPGTGGTVAASRSMSNILVRPAPPGVSSIPSSRLRCQLVCSSLPFADRGRAAAVAIGGAVEQRGRRDLVQCQIGRRVVDDRLEALRGAEPRHGQQHPDMREVPGVPFGLALGMRETPSRPCRSCRPPRRCPRLPRAYYLAERAAVASRLGAAGARAGAAEQRCRDGRREDAAGPAPS